MADFARGMQWLFTIIGLLFVGGAGADVIFDSSGDGSQDISMSCSTSGALMNCTGRLEALDDEVQLQTVATVGVGLLLVATIMAVTAGAAARRASPYPGPPTFPDQQFPPAPHYPPPPRQ